MAIDVEALKSEREDLKGQLRQLEAEQRKLEAELKTQRQREIRTKRALEAIDTLLELNANESEDGAEGG